MIVFQPHPLLALYLTVFGLFFVGEAALILWRRAHQGRAPEDRGFVLRALVTLMVTNYAALCCLRLFPAVAFGTPGLSRAGLVLMGSGLLVRWWSIAHLGRFFTVNVAVAADHRVIDSGPYRWVRHPSYTGGLLIAIGIALCFGNVASDLVLLVPIGILLLRRMRVEEATLAATLGEPYQQYMARTKRLFPGVY